MATLETASFPLIIRRNPADPTDVVNDLIQAGRMKSVRLADFIGQKSGQIRYVIRQAVAARGPSNAELLEKYAGRESFQNWGWLKQLHQNLEEAGQRGDNLENVVDAMRRAQGRFGAAEMAGFMALRAPELKALVLRLAAEKGSASSIWEAMKAVGSACHERGGGVCEVRGAVQQQPTDAARVMRKFAQTLVGGLNASGWRPYVDPHQHVADDRTAIAVDIIKPNVQMVLENGTFQILFRWKPDGGYFMVEWAEKPGVKSVSSPRIRHVRFGTLGEGLSKLIEYIADNPGKKAIPDVAERQALLWASFRPVLAEVEPQALTERAPDPPLRRMEWVKGADPHSYPPDGTEEVSHAYVDDDLWIIGKRGGDYFVMFQAPALDALVWAGSGWRQERETWFRGDASKSHVTPPAMFASVRAAQLAAERLPDPRIAYDGIPREYRYAAVNRPPGFGSVPKGHIRIEPRQPGVSIARHGFVVYDRPLSKEEYESYELYPYKTVEEVAQMVRERMGDYQAEYMEQLREDPASLAEIMPERRYFSDLEGQALQDAVYRVLVPKKNPRKLRRNPDGGPRADIGCTDEVVIDSEGRSYPIVYRVVEAALDGSTVVTSHNPQTFEWQTGAPLRYPEEFQTRDLGEPAEKAKILKIATSLDPIRLLAKNLDPTLGAPVVWPHGGKLYVLGGNGRTMAFLRASEPGYQAYLKLARCKWDCFPSGAAPHGSRWMLVREVQGIGKDQATQLAAASQKSTAASESPLAEAVGMIRSLNLSVSNMPPFSFDRLITADNIDTFREQNEAFYSFIVSRLDEAKASNVRNRNSEAARYMRAACIGFLPAAAQKASLYDSPNMEDAIIGAAPIILTTHSMASKGKLYPEYDLWEAVAAAVPIFARMQDKNLSIKAVKREVEAARAQTVIAGTKRDIDLPPMAWAVAMALHSAANTKKPESAIADLLSPYLERCNDPCYRPPEKTMFGGGLSDRCDTDQLSPIDLFLASVQENDRFYGNLYEIVKGQPAPGRGRGIFGNRGPARKLNDLLTLAHVYARHGDAPAIEWQRPLDTENAHEFRSLNPDFYRWALHKYPAERGWAGGVDALLGGMLAALPAALQTRLVSLPSRQHPLVIAALPSVLTLHQAAQRGEVAPAMDPGRSFPEGVLKAATVKEAIQAMRDYTDKARRSDPRQTALWNGRKRAKKGSR